MTKHETPKPSQATPGEIKEAPSGYRPWEDRSLPPEERFEAYKAYVQEQVLALGRAAEKLGTMEELRQLKESPETLTLFAHAEALSEMTAGEYRERIERPRQVRAILGKNLLGAEEWRAQDIDVGEPPLMPPSLTSELLDSDCPLHPGEKIKDTHLLVLIPKTVNEEPYCAVKLAELCATRKGAGKKFDRATSSDRLISYAESWKEQFWARAPQAQSEWVLIPKSDPVPKKMREKYGKKEGSKRHFLRKDVAAQEKVHAEYYTEYREVKTIELITAVLLYELTHKERLLPRRLRCEERSPFGDHFRVSVSYLFDSGLYVHWTPEIPAYGPDASIGLALARKL